MPVWTRFLRQNISRQISNPRGKEHLPKSFFKNQVVNKVINSFIYIYISSPSKSHQQCSGSFFVIRIELHQLH